MKNDLPYKKRLKWLGFGYLLLIILFVRFSMLKTIQEFKLYHKNTSQLNLTSYSRVHTVDLNKLEKSVNKELLNFKLDTLHRENSLLSVTSDYCSEHGLILKEYKPLSKSEKDSIELLTRVITIEAPFIDCIKLIRSFETDKKVGRVCSVNFKSFTDPQDKKVKLNCSIFIQNVNFNLNENK